MLTMSMYYNQSLAVQLSCRDLFSFWRRCLILQIALAELTFSADFLLVIKSSYRAGVPGIAFSSDLASFASGALASNSRSGMDTPRGFREDKGIESWINEDMSSYGSSEML